MKKTCCLILSMLAVFIFSNPIESREALEKIWSVGRENKSYGEFSAVPASMSMNGYAEKHAGGFDMKIGAKKLTGDFPGIQAGPVDGWGGFRKYPLRIQFPLEAPPAGGAVLTVVLLGVSTDLGATFEAAMNSVPRKVEIERGTNRQVLDFSSGFGEPRAVRFFFPAEILKKGLNELTLTVVEGSWVVYDYMRLEGVAGGAGLVIKDFAVTAPPFLAHGENGAGHPVRAEFFAVGGPADAELAVAVSGATTVSKFTITGGQQAVTVVVPEVAAEAVAEVSLLAGGKIISEAKVPVKPVRHFTITLIPHSHLDIGYPDLQPNVMLGQKQYLEYASDLINADTEPRMSWVSETAWPVRHLLNGVGAYEFYGPWIDNVPLMRTVSKEFLKETNSMRSLSPLAYVRSSAGEGRGDNARRVVDGSPMGWHSLGRAKGAWVELDFGQARPVAYVALRGGREVENQLKKVRLTLSDGKETKTFEDGPAGALRERLIFDTGDFPAATVKVEILEAANNDMPTSIMEIEVWKRESPDEINENVLKAIRSGRLEVTGLYLNFLTDLIPTEWLARSMVRSNEVTAKTGVPLKTAAITDVPGYSFAMPDILSGAGIKYLYPSLNPHRAKPCLRGMPGVFYWTGPGGGRVLTYRSFNTYNEGYWLGFSRSADLVEQLLPDFLAGLDAGTYPYDDMMLRLLGDITDDGPVAERLPELVADWNRRWAYPRLEIGTPAAFFPRFEEKYGGVIPQLKGTWSGYWEDGAGSTAKETGIVRDVHRALLGAGAFAAALERFDGPRPELRRELNAAEENLYLYDEHTWGAAESVSSPESPQTTAQWYMKEMPAWDALERTENAWDMLAPLFDRFAPAPRRGGRVACVPNASGVAVSRIARAALRDDEKEVAVFDLRDGKELPAAVEVAEEKREVVFPADSVPPVGIACFEIAGGGGPAGAVGSAAGGVLENDYYKIVVDESTGAVVSLVDKELGVELLDREKGFGMNEFLYVAGYEQDKPVRLSGVKVSPGASNALYSEIAITGSAPFLPEVRQTVRLHHREKKIEFINHLKKTLTYEKEAGYFAFPLEVPGGKLRLETTGGVIALEEDQLPGASRDWMSIQDAAAAVSPEYSVILATREAPLVVTGNIRILAFQDRLDPADTTVFSYPFNNYWETNYKAGQGGEMTFGYALTSVKGAAADSRIIEFGEINTAPARVLEVERPGGGDGPGQVSFLNVGPGSVRLLGVKTSADGRGIVVRVQETDGGEAEAVIGFSDALGVKEAFTSDILEENLSPVPVDKWVAEPGMNSVAIPVGPRAIRTVVLK